MKSPKILIYDIETSPNLAYVWGKWQQNVIAFEKQRELLCYAYKWLGDRKVQYNTKESRANDKALVRSLANLLNEADIVVAHNGDEFDRKVLKARMLYWNMDPLKINCSVDTKKAAKSYFSFNGNSLADLCEYLGIGKKAHTPGFDMWLGCIRDNPRSWAQMVHYNKRDVVLLEKLYKRLQPWVENHPNIAKILLKDSNRQCPICLSEKVIKNGVRATSAAVTQRWDCLSCGKKFTTRMGK